MDKQVPSIDLFLIKAPLSVILCVFSCLNSSNQIQRLSMHCLLFSASICCCWFILTGNSSTTKEGDIVCLKDTRHELTGRSQ